MTEDVVISGITTLGLIIVTILGNKKLNRIGDDAKEARDQTANSHRTNLRDDIDELKSDIGTLHADVRGIRKDVNGLRRDDGEIRRSITQQIANVRDALPVAIDLALAEHVRSCPLRTPKGKS